MTKPDTQRSELFLFLKKIHTAADVMSVFRYLLVGYERAILYTVLSPQTMFLKTKDKAQMEGYKRELFCCALRPLSNSKQGIKLQM